MSVGPLLVGGGCRCSSHQGPLWRASRPLRADVGVCAGVSGQRSQMSLCGLARDSPMGSGAGSTSPPPASSWGPPTAASHPAQAGGGGRGAPSPAWVAVTPATSVQVLLSWGGPRTNRPRLREALGLWGGSLVEGMSQPGCCFLPRTRPGLPLGAQRSPHHSRSRSSVSHPVNFCVSSSISTK